jgi:flagellar motor switch protein FliG
LKENSEYKMAKQDQQVLMAQKTQLEKDLSRARITDFKEATTDIVGVVPEDPAPVRAWFTERQGDKLFVGPQVRFEMPPVREVTSLRLPGDKARRVAYAVSQTGNVDPETVRRIGQSLAAQLDTQPARAFETGPVERVGAILNVTAATTRDDVLKGLDETDAVFSQKVRRAIFTFVHIPHRIEGRDVPKIVRVVDQAVLVTALAGARTDELAAAAAFFLDNLSQRLAQTIRDEVAERGAVKDKDAEEAQGAVITAIRELEATGELAFVPPAED